MFTFEKLVWVSKHPVGKRLPSLGSVSCIEGSNKQGISLLLLLTVYKYLDLGIYNEVSGDRFCYY